MSDIYLSLTETPTVVTLSQPVIGSSVAATVTVGNTVTVALDANSLSALENVTVTVGAAVSISNFPASQVVSVSNFPSSSTVTVGGFSTSSLPPSTVTVGNSVTINGTVTANLSSANLNTVTIGVRGSVTVGNTVTIAGVVTSGLTGINSTGNQIPIAAFNWSETSAPGGGRLSVAIADFDGRAYGEDIPAFPVNVSNSVTIGNFPSTQTVAGTVDLGNPQDIGAEFFNPDGRIDVAVGNSVTIGSLPAISGTVTVGAMPSGALTTRFGSVATANLAFITSAVTNTSRKYLLAQNISAGTVTIGIGFSPTTTQGIQLTAGGGLTFDAFCPTGAVYWLGAVTGAAYTILEG